MNTNDMYAVVLFRDPTKLAAGPEDGFRGGGLAAPFYGSNLQAAKEEVMSTLALPTELDMPVDAWLKSKGWAVVRMDSELEAQYDSLFDFDEL